MISAISSSSTSTRRRSPTSSGSTSSWLRRWIDEDVHVPRQQVAQGVLVAVLVEEVGDDDDDALAGVADRELAGRGLQVALARGAQSCSRYWIDPPHLRPAPDARNALVELAGEGVEDHPVVVHQPDERQGRGHLLAVVELGRRAEVHRQAGVEQGVDVQVFFLEEELEEELVEPAVDVPVDVPEVVADGVVAMLGELDRRPPPLALALALHPADEDLAADELELLELVQELRVEQRRARRHRHAERVTRVATRRRGWLRLRVDDAAIDRTFLFVNPCGPRSRTGRASATAARPRPTSQGMRAARKIVQRTLRLTGGQRCRNPSAVNQLSRMTSAPAAGRDQGQHRLAPPGQERERRAARRRARPGRPGLRG